VPVSANAWNARGGRDHRAPTKSAGGARVRISLRSGEGFRGLRESDAGAAKTGKFRAVSEKCLKNSPSSA